MIENRLAIVTGVGRLKGIGYAICVELAKCGIDIFFTYWHPYDKIMPWSVSDNEPDIICDEIRKHGVNCEYLELDLSDESSIQKLLEEVNLKFGKASILINNATYSTQTNIDNIETSELDSHYNVNLKAPILLSSEFIKQFDIKKGSGRIINLSSGQSLSFMNKELAYAVTKGAIETFTRTVSQELAAKNITINEVNPGLSDSGWLETEQKAYFKERFPMGRMGEPMDAAKLIKFLVSSDADWITGQVIHSEGGFIREKYD